MNLLAIAQWILDCHLQELKWTIDPHWVRYYTDHEGIKYELSFSSDSVWRLYDQMGRVSLRLEALRSSPPFEEAEEAINKAAKRVFRRG